ncbi:MAG: protein translocase subunit SecD [Myxococcota bacterium]
MKDSLFRRYALLVGCFLFSLYLLAPTYWRFYGDPVDPTQPDGAKKIPNVFFSEGLNLGLDLQGGLHLTMQVMVDEAILKNGESRATDMQSRLKTGGVNLVSNPAVTLENGLAMTRLAFAAAAERDQGRRLLEEQYADTAIELDGDAGLLLRGNLQASEALRVGAVDRALEILRGRIDQFGVAEPVLVREGADRIVIQLPGLKDPRRALDLIGKTAALEFRIVHDANASLSSVFANARAQGKLSDEPTIAEYRAAAEGQLPSDAELSFLEPIKDKKFSEGQNLAVKEPPQPILLRKKIELTGEAVVDAGVNRDPQTNEPNVSISLSPAAARVFDELTAANVNRQLAIVLDGIVKSAPNIQERIGGGQVRITGQFTDQEAADLAVVLRSGALPAPIKPIQNITVSATLGEDSIRAGFLAGIAGFFLVVVFMAWYYRLSGWIADAALLLNNTMLLGALAALDATLTLPGIAGIVLSMGMAVDSNVLVFERIRDELDMGRAVPLSIRAGFDKAFWTIFDSHVTTLLTGFVLFTFGTGPIKGFAITLCIGVALNLFTALFGTRVVYDHLLMNSSIRRLRFRQFLERPNLDFIGLRNPAIVFSLVSVVAATYALIQLQAGHGNLGIDFAGGSMITVSASKIPETGEARSILEKAGFEEPEIQTSETDKRMLVRLHTEGADMQDVGNRVLDAFKAALPGEEFKIEGAEAISAAVSKDLRQASFLAILVSLVGIIGYLSLRFDFRFGVTAAIATFHDVFFVIAVFYFAGFQFNLLLVTALLTIAGYSLTDTVVIFDRLREMRQRFHDMSYGELINRSINDVLSRTIVTSGTTLIVLISLLLFGGPVLFDFSLALFLGVLIGTYSSVFVASPILFLWEQKFGRLVEDEDKLRTYQDAVSSEPST